MDIIGRDQIDAGFLGNFYQAGVRHTLLGDILVVLKLQEKIALSEKSLVTQGGGDGLVHFFGNYLARDSALDARRHRDQAFAVFFEQFFIDARLIIKTFQVRFRHKLYQVSIAQVILCQQNQMIADVINARPFLGPAFAGHVDFAADDRLDAARFGFFIEFHRAVHVPVIGDGA